MKIPLWYLQLTRTCFYNKHDKEVKNQTRMVLLDFSSVSPKPKIMIHIKSPKEEHKKKELSKIMEKKRENYGVE